MGYSNEECAFYNLSNTLFWGTYPYKGINNVSQQVMLLWQQQRMAYS